MPNYKTRRPHTRFQLADNTMKNHEICSKSNLFQLQLIPKNIFTTLFVNSGPNRTVIPEQIEHLFRSKSNSDSGMIANTF